MSAIVPIIKKLGVPNIGIDGVGGNFGKSPKDGGSSTTELTYAAIHKAGVSLLYLLANFLHNFPVLPILARGVRAVMSGTVPWHLKNYDRACECSL